MDFKPNGWTIIQYLLAIGALVWVLSTINFSKTIQLFVGIQSTVIFAVVVVSILGFVPRVWMWMSLLEHFDGSDFIPTLRADLVIKFVNSLFPSRISGRSIAPLALYHFTGANLGNATAVTGAHTGLYALCYGLVSLVGVLLLLPFLPWGVVSIVAISTVVYLGLGGMIVAGGWHLDRITPIFERIGTSLERVPIVGRNLSSKVDTAIPVIGESAIGFRSVLFDTRAVVGYGFSWILALAVLPGIRIYLLFTAFGATPESVLLLPVYLIASYAVTILPLTPGGVGVTEATSALVFIALGYPSFAVVPAVLTDRTLGVYLPALAGWYPMASANLTKYISNAE